MQKKKLLSWKPAVATIVTMGMLGISVLESSAAFEPGYYNIKENGGTFNGRKYELEDGTKITDSFFCDGKYTYFLQADGTPMKNRLTYHPDGEQIIYFDANGRECFDTFTHVKKSISGEDVDDLCYFGTTGNMYINVITYNREGTAVYYANKCGVMERNGVFQLETDAVNYKELANGCHYGYANKDGKVLAFFKTYEEALAYKPSEEPVKEEEKYPVLKDENGNVYDLGGMEIIIRDWWSDEAEEPANDYEKAKQEYVEWAQETYNFTIKRIGISDWGSAPKDFVDYVTTGGDDKNYIFTLRDDPVVLHAMRSGLMYDLSKLDCLDFIEDKFQNNLCHEQYSIKDKIYAMNTGYAEPRTGVYFNKRLLEEAGIDPDTIYDMQANGTWTWDAWTDMMEKVQRDVDNDGVIDVYGFDAVHSTAVMAGIYSNDSDIVGMKNGKYTYELENPKTVKALEWINDVVVKYANDRENPEDARWVLWDEAFEDGECVFVVDPMYCSGPTGYMVDMEDQIGFVMFPKGPEASDYTNCWKNNPLVIPSCYDEERAWKIAFAYDIYTDDVPGYEDYTYVPDYAWESYQMDERAKKETIPMMTEKGRISYEGMIPNLDLEEPFLWRFSKSGTDVSEIITDVRDYYKACIEKANE